LGALPQLVLASSQGKQAEKCCVCYDKQGKPGKSLTCDHYVCQDCTKMLRNPTCPICRAELEGGYATPTTILNIMNAESIDATQRIKSDALFADYIQTNPTQETTGRVLVDAFGMFLDKNPQLNDNTARRIFRAFVNFYNEQLIENPGYNPLQAIADFDLIGLQMIIDPVHTPRTIADQIYGLRR